MSTLWIFNCSSKSQFSCNRNNCHGCWMFSPEICPISCVYIAVDGPKLNVNWFKCCVIIFLLWTCFRSACSFQAAAFFGSCVWWDQMQSVCIRQSFLTSTVITYNDWFVQSHEHTHTHMHTYTLIQKYSHRETQELNSTDLQWNCVIAIRLPLHPYLSVTYCIGFLQIHPLRSAGDLWCLMRWLVVMAVTDNAGCHL